MPFALSIIQENFEQIVVNPKGLLSPFMAISLDTVPTAREGISAGIHPYDKTVRPQVVSKDSNKNYYSILREFHNITGIPALLNTSFNIHGEPIVDTIEDAISTLRRSGLRHLYIQDNLLITKK
jgi:carbamoyltransferase